MKHIRFVDSSLTLPNEIEPGWILWLISVFPNNYEVCRIFFIFIFLVQLDVDRNFTLWVLCGFRDILCQALYNLLCVSSYM